MSNYTSSGPAASPPEGVTPTSRNPDDARYSANLVNTSVCFGVVNTAFILHAYVKLVIRQGRLLSECWFCFAAWIFVNGFLASTLRMSQLGEGRDIWEVSMQDYQEFLEFLYTSSALYTPAAFCTKVTLLLLISRVFSVHPIISKGIYIFIVALFLVYTPLMFLKLFTCRPISAYWDMPPGRAGVSGNNPNCLDQAQFFMGDILVAAITDLIILLLPIPLAWNMEAPRWQKIKIMFMLGAGGAATATTVVRLFLNLQFMHSTNITKDFSSSSITSVLELSIGLLCACLPSINLLTEKTMNYFQHRLLRTQDHVNTSKTDGTLASRWSSAISKMIPSTPRTMATRPDQEGHLDRPSYGNDIEMATPSGPVIFNNRLDVPSIWSHSEQRSCSSRHEDHRGMSDSAFAEQNDNNRFSFGSKRSSDDTPRKQDSVVSLHIDL